MIIFITFKRFSTDNVKCLLPDTLVWFINTQLHCNLLVCQIDEFADFFKRKYGQTDLKSFYIARWIMLCLTGKGSTTLAGLFGSLGEKGKAWAWVLTGAPVGTVAILYTE